MPFTFYYSRYGSEDLNWISTQSIAFKSLRHPHFLRQGFILNSSALDCVFLITSFFFFSPSLKIDRHELGEGKSLLKKWYCIFVLDLYTHVSVGPNIFQAEATCFVAYFMFDTCTQTFFSAKVLRTHFSIPLRHYYNEDFVFDRPRTFQTLNTVSCV